MISTKVTAVLRRRWPILAIAFAIGVLAGAVSSQLAPSDIVQQYRAEQVVVANSTGTGGVSVQQDSLKVTRGEIPTIAAEAIGDGARGDQLASDMSVTVDTASQAITPTTVNTTTAHAGRPNRRAPATSSTRAAASSNHRGSRTARSSTFAWPVAIS